MRNGEDRHTDMGGREFIGEFSLARNRLDHIFNIKT